MGSFRFDHPVTAVRRLTQNRLHGRDDSGFTLIELVVVIAVLPIIVGAITVGLISVIQLSPAISNKLSDSGDAQVLSTNLTKDVQGATSMTAAAVSTSPGACGNGTQILGLGYANGQWISYAIVTQGTGKATKYNLFRNVCQTVNGVATVTSDLIIGHNVVSSSGSGMPSASVSCTSSTASSCAGTPPAWQSNWVSTNQVASVTLALEYAASRYPQTLVAAPSTGVNTPSGSGPTGLPYSCGFATPGTGTYASTLCFIDFTAWNNYLQTGAGTTCQGGGLQITDQITNTPFSISFCLATSGGPVVGAAIPTYTDPPTSEAYLGNNGFYTGIPGYPALYQNQEGTDSTITITNIQVLGSGGVAASNWNLITGDAESTDQGESITWTAGWSPTSPIATANQVFSLVPDSPTSAIGNACADPTAGSGLNVGNGLIGIGTATVECKASVSSDKTGTPIISAPSPNSLTVDLVGTGLEAMFMGILLPG